ncbi:hypothetical protein NH340_JMT01100 [Sarcoptes scabiei]|nr:hypothetical protein NH340_JMT01100 [Sarcoptes scabiei]
MDLEGSEVTKFTVLQYLSALKADHLKKICQNPALNLNLTSNEFQSSIIEFHCRDLLPSVLSKFALSNDDELVAYRLTESGLNLSAGLLSFFEKIEEGHSNSNLRVTLIVLLSLMIVCTIVGNILVCLSVILVRKLRHPSNYLLVSLAISDLCVAVLVMPLALQYELTQSWKLSNAICDLWVSFDVTCCTSSILNLCTISIDRYLAITKPLTYGVRRTTNRILSFIVLVWIASCLISIPPVLIFGNEHGSMKQPRCEVSQNLGYQLYATLGAFYIPLLVMIVMYYKIYVAAKKVVDAELRDQRSIYSGYFSKTDKSCFLEHCPTEIDCNRNRVNREKKKKKKKKKMEELTGTLTLNNKLDERIEPRDKKNPIERSKRKIVGKKSKIVCDCCCCCKSARIKFCDVNLRNEIREENCIKSRKTKTQKTKLKKIRDTKSQIITTPKQSSSFYQSQTEEGSIVENTTKSNPQTSLMVNTTLDGITTTSSIQSETITADVLNGIKLTDSQFSTNENDDPKVSKQKALTNCRNKSMFATISPSISDSNMNKSKSSHCSICDGFYGKKHSKENDLMERDSQILTSKQRSSNALRERKASITLGIIMTAFTFCWLPFFILALLRPFSASVMQIPRYVNSIALWLGYVNSMLNPIIYVTFHQDFRRAFKYLLCLQCKSMGSRLREEAYINQYGTKFSDQNQIRSADEEEHRVREKFIAQNARYSSQDLHTNDSPNQDTVNLSGMKKSTLLSSLNDDQIETMRSKFTSEESSSHNTFSVPIIKETSVLLDSKTSLIGSQTKHNTLTTTTTTTTNAKIDLTRVDF